VNRDDAIIEILKRLNSIKTTNGFDFDISLIQRNPEEEPSGDRMPSISLFEFPDVTKSKNRRGANLPPIYDREMSVILELWYKSTSEGQTTRDIMKFLRYVRYVLFSDGVTLGKKVHNIDEEETSRVYRPGIGNFIVGIGMILVVNYLEDFSQITV
jgi:hypothetical protein